MPAGGASPRHPEREHGRNLCAAILAQACNFGSTRMADLTGIPAETPSRPMVTLSATKPSPPEPRPLRGDQPYGTLTFDVAGVLKRFQLQMSRMTLKTTREPKRSSLTGNSRISPRLWRTVR